MQLKRAVSLLSILLAFGIMGCGRMTSPKNADMYSIEDKNGTIYCIADITHDGKSDQIIINYGETVTDTQTPIKIDVIDSNGDTIWSAIIGIPHAGWGEYYISVVDKKPCFVFNCPEESQGQIAYYYKIFYLSNDGSEIDIEEKRLSGNEKDVSQNERNDFKKKVQAYIDKGDLLVSTMYGELIIWK